jgi:aryl-phospho-beta-D-glucosidase BglC (GH1 family)
MGSHLTHTLSSLPRWAVLALSSLWLGCGSTDSGGSTWEAPPSTEGGSAMPDAASDVTSSVVDSGLPIAMDSAVHDAPPAVDSAGGGGSADGGDGQAPEAEAAVPTSFVHAKGPALLDPNNMPLPLRGVNLGNWLEYEGYLWQFNGSRGDRTRTIEQRITDLIGATNAATFWQTYRQTYTTEDDIARIAALGFNSVRVPFTARFLLPEGSTTFDDTEFSYLQNVAAWGAKHGVYIILDMHAAPGGQNGTNIDDDADGTAGLFADPTNQDRYVMIWTEIARRFKDVVSVAGYDLLNEPLPEPNQSQYIPQLWPLYQRVGQAIRTVDPNHMLIVEGANWADDWSSLGAPFDDNMAYSFHKYWDATDVSSIQGYLDNQSQWMRPIWCGESGENDDSWYQAAFSMLEMNNVGWAFWPWKKFNAGNNPYSVNLPSGWGAIQAWVNDATQPQPSTSDAQTTLNQLLAAIPLAQCTYNQDVVCSLGTVVAHAPGCP